MKKIIIYLILFSIKKRKIYKYCYLIIFNINIIINFGKKINKFKNYSNYSI